MTEKGLRIGILGGCLNSGYGLVRINELYHRRMARSIEEQHGLPVRVVLGRMNTHEHSRMNDIAQEMLDHSALNILLFQIRPDFLWGLYTLLWLKKSGHGVFRLHQNPQRTHGKHWPDGLEETINPMRRFARLNFTLSRVSGWKHHAHHRLLSRMEELKEIAARKGVAFGIITPVFGSYYPHFFDSFAKREIDPLLKKLGVPVMDLLTDENLSKSCYWADHFHLNASGHEVVANIACQTISSLLMQLRTEEKISFG